MKKMYIIIFCFFSAFCFSQSKSSLETIKGTDNKPLYMMSINGEKPGAVLGIITESGKEFSAVHPVSEFLKQNSLNISSGKIVFISCENLKYIPKNILNSLDYIFSIKQSVYNESVPLVYFHMGEDHKYSALSRELAENSLLPFAVVSDKKYDIPFIELAIGKNQTNEAEFSHILKNTLNSIFTSLHFKEGESPIKSTLIIEETKSVKNETAGIFYSDKKTGEFVRKNEVIGYITNFYGSVTEEIKAPSAGIILQKRNHSETEKNNILIIIGIVYM